MQEKIPLWIRITPTPIVLFIASSLVYIGCNVMPMIEMWRKRNETN